MGGETLLNQVYVLYDVKEKGKRSTKGKYKFPKNKKSRKNKCQKVNGKLREQAI